MYRFRLAYAKEKELVFISHLELQRAFVRAIRRAGLPLAYSGGYSPQPRIIFAAPLAVGIEGKNEFVDIFLRHNPGRNKVFELLSEQLPPGLKLKRIEEIDPHAPPLSSLVEASLYVVPLRKTPAGLLNSLEKLLTSEEITVRRRRKGKKGVREINLRPFIHKIFLEETGEQEALMMLLSSGNQGGARPDEIIELMAISREEVGQISRKAVFLSMNGRLVTPDGRKAEELLSP